MSDSDPKHETADNGDEIARGDSVSTLVAPDIVIESLPAASSSSSNIHDISLPTDKTVISKRPSSTEVAPPAPPTSQSLGAALVGKKFGNYELAEFVGGGGMGAVFRAVDVSMGRTVAVKVLSRDHTDDETIRRFRNEAQSAARLDHPNIARAYYVGEHEGWNFIVFEYVQGTNLRELVEHNGPLLVEEALSYTLQVAQALDHAAGREVVHRDIKPSNVLVTAAGDIKLVDMGLARMHQVDSSADDLTASGVTLGTFDYISPEQARDPRIADSRSDIYSLGCTLYFMLAGRPPFPDGTALQKLLWHSGEEPPDPRLFRPELPTQVIRLLWKMLAKRPAQRPQSPRELMGEIAAVADELGLAGFGKGHTATLTASAGPSGWSRAASILIPVAALVLLILLADFWSHPSDTADGSLRPQLHDTIPAEKKGDKGSTATPSKGSNKTDNVTGKSPAEATPPVSPNGEQPSNVSEEPLIEPAPTPFTKNGEGTVPISPRESIATPPDSPENPPDSSAGLAAAASLAAEIRAEPAEAAVLTSSTMPPGSVAKPKIIRLIVRPDGKPLTALAADQELVSSFARACQRAAELGIPDIELQFTGTLMEPPLEIGASHLSVKATAGQKPVIVFRPELKGSGSESERQMIRLRCGSSGKVQFQGVELRLELPTDASYGWSLFAIYQMQRLVLSDCVLTIKDVGSLGVPIQQQVAFFALQPRRVADAMKMMDDDKAMMPAMEVKLNRCVARGAATFLMASEESPLKIAWTQGLLVTTQRLVETEGSLLPPTDFGRLDMDLDHVTAIVPRGLYLMKRRAANPYQLKADIRCNSSLLQTNVGSPLFEFSDLAAIEDVKLNYGGEGNLYRSNDGVFLRFHPSSRGEPNVEFKQERSPPWSKEERPNFAIVWQNQLATENTPVHQQAPKNFVLNSNSGIQAGFDPGVLPEPSEPVEKPGEQAVEPAGAEDQE